ncbi:uncharacterized protein LOC131941059 [Physella acuta]|uniref:uncharacterized protein LOC131941059 n=1 Tax=Physella acuta TaxID=109671 RepID=UPI0027DC8D2E|nr:uncharacterized protein LOC131941059 [Physella acuta]
MDKLVLLILQLYQVCSASSVHDQQNSCHTYSSNKTCAVPETPSLCVERFQSIRITSAVNGTGSGTLVVCGKNLTEHLTIMAGNDEIFPLSTRRYEVNVSESGYHSTVNITVHNLTERDQGVIPLLIFTCPLRCLDSQIWVDLKGSTDNVTFSYQFTSDTHELNLKLHCSATRYPRAIKINDVTTATVVANETFSARNYKSTMSLETSLYDPSCSHITSYICEVTDFLGNKSTRTLHVTHKKCPPRLFDVTTNNSVIQTNVNDTAMFYFDVITSGDVIVEVDSNRTQFNITRYHPQFCYIPSPNYTIYTRPSANLSVNFCLKSGVDIQHQHKMEVYVDNQRLSDKDIQVTKYNSRYQYGLEIVLHRKTYDKALWIEIKVFNVTLKSVCNNLQQPIPARLDQPLTIEFCVVSSSPLHDHIGINGHVIKVNTSHVTGLYRYVGVRRSGDDTYNVTIQLYPADVDGVQIFQILVKNDEKQSMVFLSQVALHKEQWNVTVNKSHKKVSDFSVKSSSPSLLPTTTTASTAVNSVYTTANVSTLNGETSRDDVTVKVIIGALAAVTIATIIVVFSVRRMKVKRFQDPIQPPSYQNVIARNSNDNSSQVFHTPTVNVTTESTTSRNSEGLIYVTVDHTSLRDSLSTNRSSHSQDHVVYARLDFQKMAKKEQKSRH